MIYYTLVINQMRWRKTAKQSVYFPHQFKKHSIDAVVEGKKERSVLLNRRIRSQTMVSKERRAKTIKNKIQNCYIASSLRFLSIPNTKQIILPLVTTTYLVRQVMNTKTMVRQRFLKHTNSKQSTVVREKLEKVVQIKQQTPEQSIEMQSPIQSQQMVSLDCSSRQSIEHTIQNEGAYFLLNKFSSSSSALISIEKIKCNASTMSIMFGRNSKKLFVVLHYHKHVRKVSRHGSVTAKLKNIIFSSMARKQNSMLYESIIGYVRGHLILKKSYLGLSFVQIQSNKLHLNIVEYLSGEETYSLLLRVNSTYYVLKCVSKPIGVVEVTLLYDLNTKNILNTNEKVSLTFMANAWKAKTKVQLIFEKINHLLFNKEMENICYDVAHAVEAIYKMTANLVNNEVVWKEENVQFNQSYCYGFLDNFSQWEIQDEIVQFKQKKREFGTIRGVRYEFNKRNIMNIYKYPKEYFQKINISKESIKAVKRLSSFWQKRYLQRILQTQNKFQQIKFVIKMTKLMFISIINLQSKIRVNVQQFNSFKQHSMFYTPFICFNSQKIAIIEKAKKEILNYQLKSSLTYRKYYYKNERVYKIHNKFTIKIFRYYCIITLYEIPESNMFKYKIYLPEKRKTYILQLDQKNKTLHRFEVVAKIHYFLKQKKNMQDQKAIISEQIISRTIYKQNKMFDVTLRKVHEKLWLSVYQNMNQYHCKLSFNIDNTKTTQQKYRNMMNIIMDLIKNNKINTVFKRMRSKESQIQKVMSYIIVHFEHIFYVGKQQTRIKSQNKIFYSFAKQLSKEFTIDTQPSVSLRSFTGLFFSKHQILKLGKRAWVKNRFTKQMREINQIIIPFICTIPFDKYNNKMFKRMKKCFIFQQYSTF